MKRTRSKHDAQGPAPLGDALNAWIARSGLGTRIDLARVVVEWPALVGPQIAAVTRAMTVWPDGTLLVRVSAPTWATELGLMTPRILARLNSAGGTRVQRIRWTIGPLDGP